MTLLPAARRNIKEIFRLNKELIDKYENLAAINYRRVLKIVKRGISSRIGEYRRIISEGKTAGYFLVTKKPEFWELEDLFIYPEYQNKGIGTAVLNDIISAADKPIALFVFTKNEGARRLYERLGFEIDSVYHETRYRMILRK